MFAVKRYANEQGDSMFVPTTNGQPNQPLPPGYTEMKETKSEEASAGVLKGQTAEGILKGTTSESILTGAGLMAPKKQEAINAEEAKKQTASLLQPDKQDDNRLTSTEPPETVTSANVDHLTSQLKTQYSNIQNNSGYKYKNEKELDSIFSGMAAKLAVNGINDIRDLGVEEGEAYTVTESQPDPNNPEDTIQIQKQVTPKYLINKTTGKRLQDVAFTSSQFRDDLASSGEFSSGLAKLRGDLALEDRAGFTRWGKDLSVDGQADYAIQFVDDNAVMMPVWKDTKTDLTPVMMMASAALLAAGVPGQIGGALTPAGTLPGTQLAVGNAVVSGGMTALSGGNFEDIAKAAVVSGGMSYAQSYIPQMSNAIGESIYKAVGATDMTGAKTLGTAITTAGVNGVAAAILGQDVSKAMMAGAVTSAVQLNASDFLKSTFGDDMFEKLSQSTNLSATDMEGLVVRSISRGAGAMAYDKNFFAGFKDNLIREGLSLSTANAATKAMAEKLDKQQLAKIHNTVKKTASLAILAKQRGLNVSSVLESAFPKLILNSMR